ncbi:MAG: hypothetical protein J5I98_00095 [Phaeodactylibacter sp.]|nr:hypothetical protein [Phaeodactylibacter sp.]
METITIPSNQHTLLKVAYITGPFLLLLSALSFSLGIGLIPPGITSYVEGIFGSYALLLFVPIYLSLAARLSRTHRTLGTIATITGLMGSVTGFSLELFRVIEYSLRTHGAGDAVWQSFYAQPNPEYLAVALMGPLFPLTSILLGAGFWHAKTFPAWVSAALIAAGIGFPLAQVLELEWALKATYPGACMLWLAALSYIGVTCVGKRQEISVPLNRRRLETEEV